MQLTFLSALGLLTFAAAKVSDDLEHKSAPPPTGDQGTGQCSESKGYLVVFDFNKCNNGDVKSWKPQAVSHKEAGVQQFGSLEKWPNTVCISDDDFEGQLFVNNATGTGPNGIQTVNVKLSKNQGKSNPGTAFVASRADDQAGKPGKKDPLPIFAPLTSFYFKDQDKTQKPLTGESPATEIVKTMTPHTPMYITYCNSRISMGSDDTIVQPDGSQEPKN